MIQCIFVRFSYVQKSPTLKLLISIIESEIDSVEFQMQVTKEMLDDIVIGGIPLSELSEKLNLPSE